MELMKARPPFITFEVRSEEDREKSIKAGHYVGQDIEYVFITPAGSKDRIERVVKDWFAQLEIDLANERIPAEWVSHYKTQYQAWKDGRSAPVTGTPVADWPGLSPTMLKTLQSLHLLAIEDVAAANEETIHRLGMGGRMLKQRAMDYLAAAKDVGTVAEAASAARARAEEAEARNKLLEERVEQLSEQIKALAAGSIAAPVAVGAEGISASDILDGATKL